MPRPTLHPDVIDLDMEIGQDAPDAIQPAVHGFFVVALATNRVGAGKTVMDVRRDWFQQLLPAMVIDVVEALSDQILDKSNCIALDCSELCKGIPADGGVP